jgi:hypothetical protein
MDTESSEAIDALRTDLRVVESSLRTEIRHAESSLSADIRHVESLLRTDIRDGLAENRRHFEVISESLRDDIRILAEGFASLNVKVDSLLPPQRR